MFERFTTEARQVVIDAQEEARAQGVGYVGTEHLLLALLRPESGIPFTVLSGLGLTADQVRADVAVLVRSDLALGEADADALEAIGIDLRAVRAKIEETFGPGALDPTPPASRRGLFRRKSGRIGGHVPFTRRAKKVLELALREALRLRHDYIGSEHFVLGIVREGQGLAAKVMYDAGVDADELRTRILAATPKAA